MGFAAGGSDLGRESGERMDVSEGSIRKSLLRFSPLQHSYTSSLLQICLSTPLTRAGKDS